MNESSVIYMAVSDFLQTFAHKQSATAWMLVDIWCLCVHSQCGGNVETTQSISFNRKTNALQHQK